MTQNRTYATSAPKKTSTHKTTLEMLLSVGALNAIKDQCTILLEQMKCAGATQLTLDTYNTLMTFFSSPSLTLNSEFKEWVKEILNDLWARSVHNTSKPAASPGSNGFMTPEMFLQCITMLVTTIKEGNKEIIQTLITTMAQANDSTSKNFLKGLDKIATSLSSTISSSIIEANKEMITSVIQSLPLLISQAVKSEVQKINIVKAENAPSTSNNSKDSTKSKKSTKSEDSSESPPPTQSQLGEWNFIAPSTLQWFAQNVKDPCHNLVVKIQNGIASDLGEWNLLMNAFITATVTPRRNKGFTVLSPLLDTLVSTFKAAQLAWYVLPCYALYKNIMVDGAKYGRTMVVVNFKVFDGNCWKTLNESFYWDDSVTFEQWQEHWLEGIRKLNDRPYSVSGLHRFEFTLYTVASKPARSLGSLTPALNTKGQLGSLDIETTVLADGTLLPYAVGFRLMTNCNVNTEVLRIYYLTDYLENANYLLGANLMMKACLKDLAQLGMNHTIYVHNLGGFDSTFLIKPSAELFGPYKLMVDSANDLITLTLPGNIVFKDSYRIFPSSLASLSSMFNVPIQKGTLDHSTIKTGNLAGHKEAVLDYLTKDLISLLDIMVAATDQIFDQYSVDLSTAFSAPSLAMKIYRTNFLKGNIPLLSDKLETKIRNGYKGGAVQVLRKAGNNLHFNDVNSLYPHSMTFPMPTYYLGTLLAKDIDLDTFTGFIYAVITPQPGIIPVVPHHTPGADRLIYPTERFEGLFYAEELRSAASLGYSILPRYGNLFSTKDLFSSYVHHFYNKKLVLDKELMDLNDQLLPLREHIQTSDLNPQIISLMARISSKEGERFIVKLLLNGL